MSLYKDSDPTLDKAGRFASQNPSSSNSGKESGDDTDPLVGAVGGRSSAIYKPRNFSSKDKACYFCGQSPLHNWHLCPVRDASC